MLHLKQYGNNEIVLNNTRGSSLGGFGLYDNHLEVNALSNHPLLLKTNSVERLRITSDGKLGVRVTSPGCQTGGIHAVHDATEGTPSFTGGEVGIFQRNYNSAQGCEIGIIAGSNSSSRINFGDKDDADIGIISYSHNDNSMRFIVSAAEKLRITSAGNLGINNTSPGTKLAIGDGTIDSSNVITFGKRVAGTNSNLPVIGHHSDGSGSGIAICATSSGGKIHFFTGNGSAGFGDGSNAERMRIDHNGNVCIGDNLTPNRLLHLKKASSTAYSGGSDTADYNFLKIENTTDDKSAGIFFAIGSNGEAAITATEVVDGNTDIAFQNRGGGVRSEKLRITSAGNVGIGTDIPMVSNGYSTLSLAKTSGGQVEFKKLSSGRTHYLSLIHI